MSPKRHRESDDLLEVLKAYRLPTLIVSVGIILAIFSFQLALKYDIEQSDRAFRDYSEQVYRGLDTEVRRHTQFVDSMARIIGQIRSLSEVEFSDISRVFVNTTRYKYFYLYHYTREENASVEEEDPEDVSEEDITVEENISENGETTPEETSTLREFFSVENEPKNVDVVVGLPEIKRTVEKAHSLERTYLSNPYQLTREDGTPYKVAAIATPVPGQQMKNLFLVGVLDLDSLFSSTLKIKDHALNIQIYNTIVFDRSLIYEDVEGVGKEFFDAMSREGKNILSFQRSMFFDDHEWNITISSSLESLINYIGLFPWITFLGVLVVTTLLSFIVFRTTTEKLKATKMVEQQTKSLREYAGKLEMSNRDLDDFAHIASHDLKEPLRGLYNYADFLYEDYYDVLDEKGREKLETLQKLSRRMESLVESLLEYSRLSRVDLTVERTNLNEIIRDVVETQSIWLEENNAHVSIVKELPSVVCDPVRVAEVFRNLITNAVKYNDKPEKCIEIDFMVGSGEWNDVPIFCVKDNGIGLAEEHKEQIFKIFRRLHGRDQYGGGTGAGLTIVWKIIERHGGRIWVKSKKDEGTTFFFTLKRKTNHDAKEETRSYIGGRG